MTEANEQYRVFVVDDEYVIASSLAMILRHQGFDATFFTLPMEALKAACAQAPDLLISDVVMAELSGVDLAIKVQECSPECKVLLFSGQAATAHLLKVAHAQGHDFELLLKPIHPADLLSKIRKVTLAASPASVVSGISDEVSD
jgi:DNA-binding NtrC family response regulator